MKKFLASGRFVGVMVAVQFILIVVIAFFSDKDDPTGPVLLFTLLGISGSAIVAAGISRLLVMGRRWMFASLALIACGIVGLLMGIAVQEVMSGVWPAPYVSFLMKHGVQIATLTISLIIAHFVNAAFMKKRKSIHAG